MAHKRDEHHEHGRHDSSRPENRESRGYPDGGKRMGKEEFQDIAKIGGEILKRTVVSGLGVIKDVKEGLPKEATQILTKGKEELLKSLASKELLQDLLATAIDRAFAKVREHKIEISIRITKADGDKNTKKADV